MFFSEQIDPSKIYCYQVRAVINGETGPFSLPVCNVGPPGGPSPSEGIPRPSIGTGTATPSPLPPVAGNTPLTGAETGWLAGSLVLAAGALLGLAGLLALRRR